MKVEVDATKVTALLDREIKATPKKIDRALSMTAQQGINVIVDRTEKGIGYKGAFAPYTPAYAKFRAKKGRKVAPVDLNFSGNMLSSIASRRVSKGVYEIYFTRAVEARKGAFNNIKRPFFGFNPKEKGNLSRFFRKAVMR